MKDWVENGFFTWHDDREYVDIEEINMRLKDYIGISTKNKNIKKSQ